MINRIIDNAAKMDVKVSQGQASQLLDYLNLIEKWNRVHNLTALRDQEKMLSHHILDSLSVNAYVKVEKLLDVGSGAGIPGIPLAIINPNLSVILSDSNKKKSTFQQQAIIELGLKNVTVLAGRVEEIDTNVKFDGIISRAFSEISLFTKLTRSLLSTNGKWFAMKGVYPEQELDDSLPAGIEVQSIHELTVPLLDAKRHLVIMKEVDD